MSVSEHAEYRRPEPGSPKWNTAIINVINSTSAFPALISAVKRASWCCYYSCGFPNLYYYNHGILLLLFFTG